MIFMTFKWQDIIIQGNSNRRTVSRIRIHVILYLPIDDHLFLKETIKQILFNRNLFSYFIKSNKTWTPILSDSSFCVLCGTNETYCSLINLFFLNLLQILLGFPYQLSSIETFSFCKNKFCSCVVLDIYMRESFSLLWFPKLQSSSCKNVLYPLIITVNFFLYQPLGLSCEGCENSWTKSEENLIRLLKNKKNL